MATNASNIHIREARKEDMQQIYDLIKELAKFESMVDQVKITPEILIADAFGTTPAFGCFVATPDPLSTTVVGYAIYYHCYSTWVGKSVFLEDLYVRPEVRKQGVGRALFLKVAEVAHRNSKRMDFHVLAWNPASEFYKSLGAVNLTNTEEWNMYRLSDSALDMHFGAKERTSNAT